MPAFIYLKKVLDGEERVIKQPESALSTWLPRGWEPCDPPPRPARTKPTTQPAAQPPAEAAAAPAPVEVPAEAPAPAPKPTHTKRSTSGREHKSEDNV